MAKKWFLFFPIVQSISRKYKSILNWVMYFSDLHIFLRNHVIHIWPSTFIRSRIIFESLTDGQLDAKRSIAHQMVNYSSQHTISLFRKVMDIEPNTEMNKLIYLCTSRCTYGQWLLLKKTSFEVDVHSNDVSLTDTSLSGASLGGVSPNDLPVRRPPASGKFLIAF